MRVEFSRTYDEPPTALCSINGGSSYPIGSNLSCQTALVDETGVSIYVYNASETTISRVGIYWVAIGK